MEEGKPRPMGGFISRSVSPPHPDYDIIESRALSPPGCGLLEPYKDIGSRSGVLEPLAGFLDFNQFKEALDIESEAIASSDARSDVQQSGRKSHHPKPIFFPVEVEFDELFDWSKAVNVKNNSHLENNNNSPSTNNNNNNDGEGSCSSAGTATGKLINVNNTKVAVFRYGDQVLATSDKCPHAGGPLHLGDIEMLPDKSLCVRCPWHRWSFRLEGGSGGSGESGDCVFPRARKDKKLKVFPVKLDQTRNEIKIGFDSFDSKTLRDEDY